MVEIRDVGKEGETEGGRKESRRGVEIRDKGSRIC